MEGNVRDIFLPPSDEGIYFEPEIFSHVRYLEPPPFLRPGSWCSTLTCSSGLAAQITDGTIALAVLGGSAAVEEGNHEIDILCG